MAQLPPFPIIIFDSTFPKIYLYPSYTYFGKIMRYIKISQKELEKVAKLYESVMSNACHGLFFREGSALGAEIVALANKDREKFFDIATEELKDRGWVEDVKFDGNKITVKGSIEASKGEEPTCHRLRGILRHLFEAYGNERLYCSEKKCVSVGDEACIFNIEPIE
jgi:predicted hydrocarbon binding protein